MKPVDSSKSGTRRCSQPSPAYPGKGVEAVLCMERPLRTARLVLFGELKTARGGRHTRTMTTRQQEKGKAYLFDNRLGQCLSHVGRLDSPLSRRPGAISDLPLTKQFGFEKHEIEERAGSCRVEERVGDRE
jgi:hypothetical protein